MAGSYQFSLETRRVPLVHFLCVVGIADRDGDVGVWQSLTNDHIDVGWGVHWIRAMAILGSDYASRHRLVVSGNLCDDVPAIFDSTSR